MGDEPLARTHGSQSISSLQRWSCLVAWDVEPCWLKSTDKKNGLLWGGFGMRQLTASLMLRAVWT